MDRVAVNSRVPQVKLLQARSLKNTDAQPQASDTDKQAAACLQLLIHASECQDDPCSQPKCLDMKVKPTFSSCLYRAVACTALMIAHAMQRHTTEAGSQTVCHSMRPTHSHLLNLAMLFSFTFHLQALFKHTTLCKATGASNGCSLCQCLSRSLQVTCYNISPIQLCMGS
jgi:hypothetical protein